MTQHSEAPTRLLEAQTAGDGAAAKALLPLVYDELRALAARYLRSERPGHSLQPTDLVHEAYLRLIRQDRVDWKGKAHFYAVAAMQMRRILVDHARAKAAQKRPGSTGRVTLNENLGQPPELSDEFLAVDQALTRLQERHERQGKVAELHLFAGMLFRELAFYLGVSERTVMKDWRVARAWLKKELSASET